MAQNALVRARIDEDVKRKAEAILATIGLTTSDALRLLLHRVVAEKRLPFAPLVPNAETIKAIEDARAGRVERVVKVADIFKHAKR
jgi:DNA-damage-inducible protein J